MSVFVERRRAPWDFGLILRVLAGWLLVCGFLLLANWPGITQGRMVGPDDMLRLQQVRDLIGGQAWYDLHQHRIDAPHGGVPMHWSRLVDIPLLGAILALKPLVGTVQAEIIASVAVPLFSLLALMLLAARIAWFLLGREEATMTVFVLALSSYLLFQFSPMRIDHHAWQVVWALAAVNGMMARSALKGGIAIGVSLAVWLSISMEGLPMAAVICALLALRWLRDPAERWWLVHTITTLAFGSLALFAMTRGVADLGQHCDAVSPFHLLIFLWGALALRLLAVPRRLPLPTLLAGFAVIGAGAVGIVLAVVPECATGGFSQVDPVVLDIWFSRVGEGQPLVFANWERIVQALVIPVIGLVGAAALTVRSRDWMRRWWFDYLLLQVAAAILALLVMRATVVAAALAAVPAAWMLARSFDRARAMGNPLARFATMLAVLIVLLPITPALVSAFLFGSNDAADTSGNKARAEQQELGTQAGFIAAKPPEACGIAAAAGALNALPPGETLAPIDPSTYIVFLTQRDVVATSHHRGDAAMRFVLDTFLAPPQEARRLLEGRGTRYVAICAGHHEIELYRKLEPHSLAAMLDQGAVPDWLEPIALPTNGTLKYWRVRQAGLKSSASPLMQ